MSTNSWQDTLGLEKSSCSSSDTGTKARSTRCWPLAPALMPLGWHLSILGGASHWPCSAELLWPRGSKAHSHFSLTAKAHPACRGNHHSNSPLLHRIPNPP